MAGKVPVPEAAYFEINAALWSDGAWKQRWILLPPGKSIPYDDTTDLFDYPDSTVFVKSFWLESREGDTASRIPWETRLLMKRAGGPGGNDWHGFSYRWNRAGSEAYLVPPAADFDTLFRYADAGGRRTYKRWRFPSANCAFCHKSAAAAPGAVAGRAVLGFFPAQLKRSSPVAAGRSQIAALFARGVFTGTEPDAAALERRFLGIREPVPAGASPEDRRRMLDNQARAYLAANCSGCHGYRGIAIGAIGGKLVNFDFHTLSPAIPFAHFPTETFHLEDTTTFPPTQDPYGRAAFIEAVAMAGLDTGAGRPWRMKLPPAAPGPEGITPALLYPGYPSVTELLYRQVRRAGAWVDSARLFRLYSLSASGGDSVAADRLTWLFRAPWGSSAWEDSLAAHGWTPDSVFAVSGQFADGRHAWLPAPEQMPPLGTYVPDTAALNLLAEWVRGYAPPAAIRARLGGAPAAPRLHGRILTLPGLRGRTVTLSDLRGRRWTLAPAGPGTYRLPEALRAGVYILGGGPHAFRIAVF